MKNNWPEAPLESICRPRQWPTISFSQLTKDGYPVYGANGRIGFYKDFTHKNPTLMITCRGATCGTLNISEPHSYITGNAMALDDLDESAVDLKFLYYTLQRRGLSDSITGSAQPQITRQSLEGVTIPLPPLSEQKRIAGILDQADGLRRKRQQALALTDQFLRSTFLDLFGDPVTNPKRWPMVRLDDVSAKVTDGEHLNPVFAPEGVPMVMAANVLSRGISFNDLKFIAKPDHERFTKKCNPERNDLLIVSRGATIGRCTLVDTDRRFSLMGSVILVKPDRHKIIPGYLKALFSHPGYYQKLFTTSSASAQQAIYLSHLKEMRIPLPDIASQKSFDVVARTVETHIEKNEAVESASDALFNSLVQRAFRGEL